MNKNYLKSKVIKNSRVSDDIYTLYLDSPQIAKECKPGQFINIYFSETLKIFPRPFSISQKFENQIVIRYKVIGTQTKKMSNWSSGKKIQIMGPLGNPFSISKNTNSHILIGGGIGVAPLFFLRDVLSNKEEDIYFFTGAMTKANHYITKDERSKLYLSTDDGSLGFKGNVVDLFKQNISEIPSPYTVYSCGPEPMLKNLKQYCQSENIELQISFEKIMGCGQGLCQGCAIEASTPQKEYFLVCEDGPVFNAEDIIIHD